MTAPKTRKQTKTRSTGLAERLDDQAAAAARKKVAAGERPSRDEMAALRRVERREEELRRWEYYRAIPKKHICDMTGRAREQLHRLADQWRAPLRGRHIDLVEFMQWFMAFMDENKSKLLVDDEANEKTAELNLLRAKAREKIELDLAERRKELRHVDDVRRVLDFAASFIRRASRDLNQEFGPRAYQILEDAFTDMRAAIDKMINEAQTQGGRS